MPVLRRDCRRISVAQWITFVIFGGGGLALLYVGVTQYFLQRRLMANAIAIEVEIIKSEIPTKLFLKKEEFAGPAVFIIIGIVLPPLAWIVGKYV